MTVDTTSLSPTPAKAVCLPLARQSAYEGDGSATEGSGLSHCRCEDQQQAELDLAEDQTEDRTRLMGALDALNQRFGRGTVLMASAGLAGDKRQWSMKQERRTPGYTTRWAEIPVVRA
jgi:DNA polymerase V